MEPPPLSGRRFRFTIRTSFYNRPAIPRRKSERIPTRGPIADRREYVVVLSFVGLRPAEDASTACGGTMQPSAWSGCGLPLSGRSRRANLLQSLVLAESECESVGNILNVYPEASRTSDWAFPARSGFTTFCHRKVAQKCPQGTSVGIGQRLSLSAGVGTRCFSPCLIFWCFWIKTKAQEERKCTTEEIDSPERIPTPRSAASYLRAEGRGTRPRWRASAGGDFNPHGAKVRNISSRIVGFRKAETWPARHVAP